MNVIERERILRDAARRYLRGEIDYDEMTAIRLSMKVGRPAKNGIREPVGDT